MSRRHLSPEVQVELMRRQFFQLTDPRQVHLPIGSVLKAPEVQALIYKTMFRDDAAPFPPPSRYRLRVLKRVVEMIETSVTDPEEDEISDDLTSTLAMLMAEPPISPITAARQKHYVTYTLPTTPLDATSLPAPTSPVALPPSITLLESQDVLASAGTTGRRTWEAALHLGTVLFSPTWSGLIQDATVLELGAGTGFLAILCARHLQARYVLATDGSGEVVDDLEQNLYLNGLEGSEEIETGVLKWGHALIPEMLDEESAEEGGKQYDVILGSDLIYDKDAVRPLTTTIHQLFDRNGQAKALISATVRNEATLNLFEASCDSQGLKIERLPIEPVEPLHQSGFFHALATPIRTYLITTKGS